MKHQPIVDIDDSVLERLYAKIRKGARDECWPWTAGANEDGRGKIGVKKRGKQRLFIAARLVYWDTFGIDPGDEQVLHSCNNAACCNPNHFYLGTDADNRRDSVIAGTYYHGEDHHLAKLTASDVAEIKKELMRGTKQRTLAERFKVCEKTISNIAYGIVWKDVHVDGFEPRRHQPKSSRHKGISWHKQKCRWMAYSGNGRDRKEIGGFHTEEEAVAALNSSKRKAG